MITTSNLKIYIHSSFCSFFLFHYSCTDLFFFYDCTKFLRNPFFYIHIILAPLFNVNSQERPDGSINFFNILNQPLSFKSFLWFFFNDSIKDKRVLVIIFFYSHLFLFFLFLIWCKIPTVDSQIWVTFDKYRNLKNNNFGKKIVKFEKRFSRYFASH